MMFGLLLLLGTIIPGPSISTLIEGDHFHQWSELKSDDEKVTAWLDTAWEGSDAISGATYPLALIRFRAEEAGETEVTGDMILAIDCPAKKLGVVSAWYKLAAFPQGITEQSANPTFDFAKSHFNQGEIQIFQQACGQDWTT